MKRSQFCKKLLNPGIACGCALGLHSGEAPESALPVSQNETPCDKKMEFTQRWVKRFFEILDTQIDEETRVKLMRSNGTECARGAYGGIPDVKEATFEEIDKTIASWQERIGKENIYLQDNMVYFNYTGSPKGLKISDGYCLCPMVENGPVMLSSTYCQCSVGYVSYMFNRFITFRPVNVELLESLRSGGKTCRFRITL